MHSLHNTRVLIKINNKRSIFILIKISLKLFLVKRAINVLYFIESGLGKLILGKLL